MKINYDRQQWNDYWLDTGFNAINVKTIPPFKATAPEFQKKQFLGRLSEPSLVLGRGVDCDEKMYDTIRKTGIAEVVVIGHAEEPFVWTGTPEEFEANWIGD